MTGLWQFDRTIPSENAASRQVLEAVLAAMGERQWSENDLFAVHLALHEALVNAVRHGNANDASKRVHVRCQIDDESIRIAVADEGPGFNPARVPDCTDLDRLEAPCGRGVMLMRAYMSRVEFNARGNEVRLEKRRA